MSNFVPMFSWFMCYKTENLKYLKIGMIVPKNRFNQMLTKKQLKILDVFQKNTFREYSYGEVKILSKEKSNSVVQGAIKSFLGEGLVTERAVGTSRLYAINHESGKVYLYFEILNRENLPKQILKTVKELKDSLGRHTPFYSIVIFGSYAAGEQKKDSDLDIAIFIEEESRRKVVEAVLKSAELKSFLKIDGHTVVKDEFLEMLSVDYENLGKEIARKHRVVHNPAIFYSLLNEGVKHGFKL